MKTAYLSFALFSAISLSLIQAQNTKLISKSEVIERVATENQSIKISVEEFNEAKAEFMQTNAVFLPNISVAHTGFSTTNPLMAFGSKLNQEIVTQADFNPDLLNDPDQIQNFATVIDIQQPLLNMDALYSRRAAKYKMGAMELSVNRTKQYVDFELDKAYMQLQLAYKAVNVLETALKGAEANLELAENSFKQGYIQRADVLLVEVRVTDVKSQLQSAKSNLKNASDYLSFLMNSEEEVIYQPSDTLSLRVAVEQPNYSLSEERSDIKAMNLSTEAYKSLLKSDQMSFLPTLNAFGSYQLYDDQIFQFGASGYIFGAELKWNILQGSQRFGKVKKSKASVNKSELEYQQYLDKSQLELQKTKRSLEDAEQRVGLTELAMKQSKEALRIRTDRFEEGLEKTTDLLIAETQYAQRQLEYYQTVFEYNTTKSYLTFLTTIN
jgi:outer membrane protein TolC